MNPAIEDHLRDLAKLSETELLLAGFLVLLDGDNRSIYATAVRAEVERRVRLKPKAKFPSLAV